MGLAHVALKMLPAGGGGEGGEGAHSALGLVPKDGCVVATR